MTFVCRMTHCLHMVLNLACPIFQAGSALSDELRAAKERLAKLEEENMALKTRKLTLADLASSPDPRGLHPHLLHGRPATVAAAPSEVGSYCPGGKGLKRGYAASSAGSIASTVRDEGITIVRDFSEDDLRLYKELEQRVMACWNAPGPEALYEGKGTRPMTRTEVEDMAKQGGYTVEETLNWRDRSKESWAFFQSQGSDEPQEGGGSKYPKGWPRKPRTKVDDLVKQRKMDVLLALSRLVKDHLGKESNGLPDGKHLHEFLMEHLTDIWNHANEPVTTRLYTLPSNVRNGYLTVLLQPNPVSWAVVSDVLTSLWPIIQHADWNIDGKIAFWEEKCGLEAKTSGAQPSCVISMKFDDEVSSLAESIATSDSYMKVDVNDA